MKRLPNTSISDLELRRILTTSFFSSGSEAVICRTGSNYELRKIFISGRLKIMPMSDNKFKKIERIYQLQLENCVRPLRTIENNGKLIGYDMSYNPNDRRFFPSSFTRKETIHHLEKARSILKYLKRQGIIYGDTSSRNILIDNKTGAMTFCDMDNVCIDSYPIDYICRDLMEYEAIRGIDASTDAYLHNIFTLRSLGLDLTSCDRDDIKEEFTEPAAKIVEDMQDIEKFNGEYLIQYVKK